MNETQSRFSSFDLMDDSQYLAQFDDILDDQFTFTKSEISVPTTKAEEEEDEEEEESDLKATTIIVVSKKRNNSIRTKHQAVNIVSNGTSVASESVVSTNLQNVSERAENREKLLLYRPSSTVIRLSPKIVQNQEQLQKLEDALAFSQQMLRPLPIP